MSSADLLMLAPAMLASILIIMTHVPLGHQVLRRGIIFIDLAIAQVAALGVVVAHLLELHQQWPGSEYLFAALAALSAAGLISLLERYARAQLEALIGCIYVIAATGALLVLSYDPHGAELIKQSLNGSLLWLSFDDIWHHAWIYIGLMLLFWRLPQLMKGHAFYLLFSLAITSSVQMVGIYLVFATLIMPALATYRILGKSRRLGAAYLIGLMGYALGICTSMQLDLPTGAAIVWGLGISALVGAWLLKPATSSVPGMLHSGDTR